MTVDVVCAGTSRALGLSNELFVLGDSVVLTVLGQVAFMPVLVLAAKMCPEVSADVTSICCCTERHVVAGPWLGSLTSAGLPCHRVIHGSW